MRASVPPLIGRAAFERSERRRTTALVCPKLRLRAGEIVVEAGCGWGALALHMARHYGVRVKAFNVSREQLVSRARGPNMRASHARSNSLTITAGT